jgi:hypothetical protein
LLDSRASSLENSDDDEAFLVLLLRIIFMKMTFPGALTRLCWLDYFVGEFVTKKIDLIEKFKAETFDEDSFGMSIPFELVSLLADDKVASFEE